MFLVDWFFSALSYLGARARWLGTTGFVGCVGPQARECGVAAHACAPRWCVVVLLPTMCGGSTAYYMWWFALLPTMRGGSRYCLRVALARRVGVAYFSSSPAA